ncbi:hypothetical protein P152DRAFT_385522, partial [Eremomyces bilateralis CBS 781.70]
PIPSQLILLSDLPKVDPTEKVRFLSCVQSYDPAKGLILGHNCQSRLGAQVSAVVEISHLLPDISPQLLQVGEWVNVIGYVQENPGNTSFKPEPQHVPIQAVMLWSAGAIDIAEYE